MADNQRCSKIFQTPKSEAKSEEEPRSYSEHKGLISSLPCEDGHYCYRKLAFIECALLGLLSAQKHFKPSPDDIFLNTSFKSGTTWIRALAFAVAKRRPVSNYKDHPRQKMFDSHLPRSLLPDSVKNEGRIVYVSRDPNDVLDSMWRYLNGNRGPSMPFMPLGDMFESFCNGSTSCGPIWDHQMEYKRESPNRPDMVLFMIYEEMKAKAEESVRKLALNF